MKKMRRRSRLREMMTMKKKFRRQSFQTTGHCCGHSFPSNKRTSRERREECRLGSGAPGEWRYPETSCSRRPNWAMPVQSIGSLQTTSLPCGIPWGSTVLRREATQRRRSAKNAAAVASATSGVEAPSARQKQVKAKRAKEEEEDANEEWWQAGRRRCRRGRQRGYGKERRGCSTSVRQ